MEMLINNHPLSDLDIADLNLAHVNQDVDNCDITLNADTFAAIPAELQPGQIFDLHHGGRRVYQGVVLSPEQVHGSAEEKIVLRSESVEGRKLRETMFQNSVQYWNGSALVSSSFEKVVLKGTITQVVRAAVEQVCQVGSLDLPPFMPFPQEEHDNISCLDVIRRALSYVPGAVVYFYYGSNPPTFCALRHDSSFIRTLAPSTYTDNGIKKITDQQVRRVRFSYVRPIRIWGPPDNGVKYDRSSIDSMELSATDASATLPSITENMYRTITLPGSADVYTTLMRYNERSIEYILDSSNSAINSARHNEYLAFWKRCGVQPDPIPRLAASTSVQFYWVSDPYGTPTRATLSEMYDPSINSTWDPHEPLYHRTADYPAGIPIVKLNITQVLSGGPTYTASNLLAAVRRYPRLQRLTRTIRSGETAVPTGVAQTVQTALNRDQYEGSLTLDVDGEVDASFDLSIDRLIIDGLSVAGIRRRYYNAMTGITRLDYGPPRHLSPADHIRHKMYRPQS